MPRTPCYNCIGTSNRANPAGRDGYEVDLHTVLEHMSEANKEGKLKAVELNASPYRLDLDWRLCKRAKELGVPVVINPDAHSIQD